jgi:hypothetical protein
MYVRSCHEENTILNFTGENVHDDFYVIATGNPSRFRGRLELPMSLQTRFMTLCEQRVLRIGSSVSSSELIITSLLYTCIS